MDFPDILTSSKIVSENIDLKNKLTFLKRKYIELKRQSAECSQCNKNGGGAASNQSKSCGTQTEGRFILQKPVYNSPYAQVKKISSEDIAKTEKVLEMHSQLLRRYDREVKLNMSYAENVSELNVKLAEAEKNLREEKELVMRLKREIIVLQHNNQMAVRNQKKGEDTECNGDCNIKDEIKRLKEENKSLKKEILGFDHSFFEEIEDMKYSLVQSKTLNQKYERIVKDLCSRYKISIPTKF